MTMTTTTTIDANSEAYNTGYEAARQGKPRRATPYCRGTIDWDNWMAGWTAAAPHGLLMRYSDASYIRLATARERQDSVYPANLVIVAVVDGKRVACYVED